MSDIKINRINRNFTIRVHLYFNSSSYNKELDNTPRFYLKPVKLLNIEKTAFTNEGALAKGYTKYGNKFYKWINDDTLTDEQAESIFAEIQTSYPYGYAEGDTAGFNKWYLDVKRNVAFQSFYKTYWENNSDKVIQPKAVQGALDYPHPYIEFDTNEIITYKHNTGTIPDLGVGINLFGEYNSGTIDTYYSRSLDTSCHDKDINVTINHRQRADWFQLDGQAKLPIRLSASGRHRLDLLSGQSTYTPTWPTGSDGTPSGYRFRLSTGVDGSHNGYSDYTDGVSYVLSPETKGNFWIKTMTKTAVSSGGDDGHPYMYSGSTSGYAISGSGGSATGINVSGFGFDEGPNLTLRRDSTYHLWAPTGLSGVDYYNSGHYLQIATDPSGGWGNDTDARIFTTGVVSTTGYLGFTVPYTAPDTLYYVCRNHAYMGGRINIVDSPTAPKTGSVPGESVLIKSTGDALEQTMFYYSPDKSGMGGVVFMQSGCEDTASF